ncbi:nitroreductase family deazaflavin-dependent oxidoreductase [bacterium]|jgi:deazaflavin-dependent oxidoreductase (nitroreductase family)|nr:nitroreductase family deazaflavin-dependent oxidoreductase [bacterium]
MKLWGDYHRWLYKGGRPNAFAKAQNRISATLFGAGVGPQEWAKLEVRGRRSGAVRSFPVAIATYEGGRYVVAMLGEQTNWVKNVEAAGGVAVLRHRHEEPVRLDLVPPAERAPILKRYTEVAPGARPHIPVDRRAPLREFEAIASQFPVFRVELRQS